MPERQGSRAYRAGRGRTLSIAVVTVMQGTSRKERAGAACRAGTERQHGGLQSGLLTTPSLQKSVLDTVQFPAELQIGLMTSGNLNTMRFLLDQEV